MKLRACHPHNFRRLIEYNREDGRFDGVVGDIVLDAFNFLLISINSLVKNVTVDIQADNLGVGVFRPELGHFDGCLGQLQANKSDILVQLKPYPTAVENVTQGFILFETSLVFGSVYNKTEIGASVQVIKSFEAFSNSVWFVCVMSCLTFFALLKIESKLYRWARGSAKKRPTTHVYEVLTHCTRIGQMTDGRLPRRIIFISASIFSLVVIHFFCTFIKTELVVIKDPLVFKSYDDIIERGAIPIFMKGMSYDSFFNEPGVNPIRKKLWDYAVKSFGVERLYVEMTPVMFLLVALTVFNQKVVVVTEKALMPIIPTSGCHLASRNLARVTDIMPLLTSQQRLRRYMNFLDIGEDEKEDAVKYASLNPIQIYSEPEVLFHVSQDERETNFNQGIILNSFGNKQLMDAVHLIARRLFETGFIIEKMRLLGSINLLKNEPLPDALLGKAQKNRMHLVDKCRSESIVKPYLSLRALTIGNFRDLIAIMALIYLLLSLRLAYEVYSGRCRCKWRRATEHHF